VLEMVRTSLCQHVHVLPEAASIVFGGGFPRHDDPTCRRALNEPSSTSEPPDP
jgi:hypothetical protein